MKMMNQQHSTTSLSGILVFILWMGSLCNVAQSTKIYQSSSALILSLEDTDDALSVENVYVLELNTASFLQASVNDAIPNILNLEVAVRNVFLAEGALTVTSKVTVTYVAESPIASLPAMLDENVDKNGAAAAVQATSATISFGTEDPTKEVGELQADDSADTGLVAAVVCLSIALFMISSVVCYTSGGFDAFKGCCVSIFFNEGDVENGDIKQVETHPVQSYDEDANRSVAESSVAGTAADGILGAVVNDESSVNPTDGLGIKTPLRDQSNITGSEYGDDSILDTTPMSEVTPNNASARPLGIMSMRKLPPPTPDTRDGDNDDVIEYGLSRMVLGRLKHDGTK